MKYFIYIDESGDFEEGLAAQGESRTSSVVGGVCGQHSTKSWKKILKNVVQDFNAESPVNFSYPHHFHCGPLLAGGIRVAGPVSRKICRSFCDAVVGAVAREAGFTFISRNPASRFEFSPQATYVTNLVSAVRLALDELAKAGDVEACDIEVAQRTITETEQSRYGGEYMKRLLRFVNEQVQMGDGSGTALARRLAEAGQLRFSSGVGDKAAGLMAADFVCSYSRARRPLSPPTLRVVASDVLLGDYKAYYDKEVLRLIDNKQYATAAVFMRQFFPGADGSASLQPVMYALAKETDPHVLARELPALVGVAECWIDERVVQDGRLSSATRLLEAIDKRANSSLEAGKRSTSVLRAWVDAQVRALSLLGSCYSHTGAVGPQAEVETRLSALLDEHRDLVSRTYLERRELLLEAKVRNLNLLFNDYRFEEVLSAIEPDIDARRALLPKGEPDELLGKMLGSVGQACAFMARRESGWAEMARDALEESLEHFAAGTAYHAMSVNYLATLAWQDGRLEDAVLAMKRHTVYAAALTCKDDVVQNLVTLCERGGAPFDVVNLLRIASSAVERDKSALHSDQLERVWQYWEPRLGTEHPHEQLAKWLGVLYLQVGRTTRAAKLLELSHQLCAKHDFTVHTIGLSSSAVLAVAYALMGDETPHLDALDKTDKLGAELCAQSAPFELYLASAGGLEGMIRCMQGCDLAAALELARWLPFNYA